MLIVVDEATSAGPGELVRLATLVKMKLAASGLPVALILAGPRSLSRTIGAAERTLARGWVAVRSRRPGPLFGGTGFGRAGRPPRGALGASSPRSGSRPLSRPPPLCPALRLSHVEGSKRCDPAWACARGRLASRPATPYCRVSSRERGPAWPQEVLPQPAGQWLGLCAREYPGHLRHHAAKPGTANVVRNRLIYLHGLLTMPRRGELHFVSKQFVEWLVDAHPGTSPGRQAAVRQKKGASAGAPPGRERRLRTAPEVDNPFRPGSGEQPPVMAGRGVVMNDFEAAFEEVSSGNYGGTKFLVGASGLGKTALLARLGGEAQRRGMVALAPRRWPRTARYRRA